MIILKDINKIDKRHTVDIISSYSHANAIQLNEDGTYDSVTYMIDDVRTYNNEAIIDATDDELESYRKYCRKFQKGDKVLINQGRKMRGQIKIVKSMFKFVVPHTYGKQYTDYLVFEDGTKVNKLHCIIL